MSIFANINLDTIEEQQEFTPIPDGTYKFLIDESREKEPRAGGAPYLALKLIVAEGPHENRHFYCNLSIQHPSDTPRNIALARLKELCDGIGIKDISSMDPEDLENKFIIGRVKNTKKGDREYSNITKFGPVIKEEVGVDIDSDEIPF